MQDVAERVDQLDKEIIAALPDFQGVECRAEAIHDLKMVLLKHRPSSLLGKAAIWQRVLSECRGLTKALTLLEDRARRELGESHEQ